jgi:alpha-amylase
MVNIIRASLRNYIPSVMAAAMFYFLIGNVLAQPVPLTFVVDMSSETISADGVHVAGNFQAVAGFGSNWDPGASPMADQDGDNVYELTVMVPPGTYLYKFVNGASWQDKAELPSADCAVNDGNGNYNRQVSVGNAGITLPSLQFDSCNAVLRFVVNMSAETVSPEGVHVMGDFQEAAGFPSNWDPLAIPMEDPNADGTYEVSMQVEPGAYRYVFVNGTSSEAAENPPSACADDDGNGNYFRNIVAEIGRPRQEVYCFNTCDICDPAINTDYETYWWNDAVFYEIFVRSFYDSDNDGIGDFQGIIQKLDYLNDGDPETDTDLGITGIWLMPMMESPSYHGYDATDYYKTEPDYGSMEDFEELLDAAHARGIKIIIDFVMNHSSSQHPWFTQSTNDQNGYRDWYIWKDNNPGFSGPWGQTVWHSRGGDYYYGLFWSGMPDLNYDKPELKSEMFSITEFWLDKGVDGFRLDAIKYLDEDGTVLENTPETFQLLQDFNIIYKTKNPDALTVGEVWSNTASILPYIQDDRLDICFEFDLSSSILNGVNSKNPLPINSQIQTIQAGYPRLQYATFLTNHDIDRVFSIFNSDAEKMKHAASLYLTLPGIPFLYYGEEIGMTGTGDDKNKRRPMQWNGDVNAGFSTQTPWYPVGSNYPTNNVSAMQGNSNSLLEHYKTLIHLRNELAPLRRGYLLSLDNSNNDLLSFARIYENEAVIVLSNFNDQLSIPSISMINSSLPAGKYIATEEMSQSELGFINLNEEGGFSDWQPASQNINPSETWIISLTPDATVSTKPVPKKKIELTLFPNPAAHEAKLEWASDTGHETTVQIVDLTGKVLQQSIFLGAYTELNLESLPPGVYFVKASNSGNTFILRLIVAR